MNPPPVAPAARRRPTLRRIALPLAAALLLPVLLVARGAVAQGTDGAISDPISTQELLDYAERLELSPQQRTAFETIHDAYKRDFRTLRDGRIARLMDEASSMGQGMPQRKQIEHVFEEIDGIQKSITSLEDRLFDQLVPLLTETQLARLPRVRLARERARYAGQQMTWAAGARPVDLSEIFLDLDLDPETRAVADPMMATYERRLTAHMRKLSAASDHMFLDMFDALEAQGFTDRSQEELMQDPEQMKRMMEAMQVIWGEVTAKVKKLAAETGDLNRTTYRSVEAVLPPDPARAFREQYYRRSYPELSGVINTYASEWLRRVRRLEEVTDEQREQIAALLAENDRRIDAIVTKVVDLVEKHRKESSPFEFGSDAWQEYNSALQEQTTEATKVASKTMEAIQQILGAELSARMMKKLAEETANAAIAVTTGADVVVVEDGAAEVEVAEGDAETRAAVRPFDPLVPARMSRRDLDRVAKYLGVDDAHRPVLDELYHGYVEAFDGLAVLDELKESGERLWTFDEATREAIPPTEKTIEDLYALRRRALSEILALEARFFDDVGVALLSEEDAPALERARRSRLRQVYDRPGAASQYGPFGEATVGVDLVEIVEGQKMAQADLAAIDPILSRYEEATVEPLRARYEAHFEYSRVSEVWNATQRFDQQQDVAAAMELGQRWQAAMKGPSERLSQSAKTLVELNRGALDEMTAALTPVPAQTLRLAYNRVAFPSVYVDPTCIEVHLTRALALEDLSDEQRRQLDELAATYRPEYERCCREMVELSSQGRINPMTFEPEDWRELQARRSQLEKLRFDRSELNLRAISRLRTVLTESQITRLGGLPEPPKDEATPIYW